MNAAKAGRRQRTKNAKNTKNAKEGLRSSGDAEGTSFFALAVGTSQRISERPGSAICDNIAP